MTALAKTPTHVPIRFPKHILFTYLAFLGMMWLGVTIFAFGLTATVSIWNEITVSAWRFVGQAARWFALGLAGHLGWVMFELYLTYGRTRRAFFIEATMFLGVFVVATAALYTLTFPLEAGYYALAGWQHGLDGAAFYDGAFDIPMIFLESTIVFLLWAAGGFFVATAWYRNGLLGGAAIVIGIGFAALSGISLGDHEGPAFLVLDRLPILTEPSGQPNLVAAVLLHIGLAAALMGLSWLWVRDMPVHGKSE